MTKLITVIIGMNIESHPLVAGGSNETVSVFPELSARGFPMHCRDTVRKFDELVKKAVTTRFPLRVITHSNAIVNHLGELISQEVLTADEVVIHLYTDKNDNFYLHSFDKEGFIERGWPFGWFDPL